MTLMMRSILSHLSMSWSKGLLLLLTTLCVSCYHPRKDLELSMHYDLSESQLNKLPSHFPAISPEERAEDWAKEYLIAINFAKELDYYRALTFFKRAKMLADDEDPTKVIQVEYAILYTYYLAGKYRNVIEEFEKSHLRSHVEMNTPAFDDLLIILHDSYLEINDRTKAEEALELLKKQEPKTAKNIAVYDALSNGDFQELTKLKVGTSYEKDLDYFIEAYQSSAKSMRTAGALAALLPGAGYFYVGQTRSGITSFFINALFIAATVHFFQKDHIAAGVISLGFEMGWYFGGIYGSQMAAKYYNERLYGEQARIIAERYHLFPPLQLRGAF